MGEPDAAKVEEALVNFRRFAAVLDGKLAGVVRAHVRARGLAEDGLSP